ncbi:TetR/AcrR family transcriptional regulator [Dactylosporangium cerinum]|uniref:TetR/AcrR family transcriptional regulator n=1 Tax=Dactylosporangium cerinum TaxID=1434730 RepID=A0ABV9W3T8_9ACTN
MEQGYRRSAGSARGEARRQALLESVTEDLAEHGLVDFSLRRAARAAGTTHKVLLYYFDGVDDLLVQAVDRLRARRIDNSMAAAALQAGQGTLAARIEALWPVLVDPRSGHRVLEQSTGLAMYDPARYSKFGREATQQYLPPLLALCPPEWSERRRTEVAELILATLRGLLLNRVIGADPASVEAGFAALLRALEREEAAT